MKLNRNNYELYFANYFEGQLKPEEVDELMSFLKNNADLEDEFYSFKNISLPEKENIFFENKNKLKKSTADKKSITEKNIDEFLIAYIENDLPPVDVERLELFLKENPKYQSDLEIFRKTISLPDLNVIFDDKKTLKKKTVAKEYEIKYFNYTADNAATLTETNIDEFLIAYIENDLTPVDVERVELFLKENPQYLSNLEIFRKTISTPDLNVRFNDKKSLKKKTVAKEYKIKYFYYSVVAAAACILLFFNIFFSDISPINSNEGLRLAQKDIFLEASMPLNLFSGSDNNNEENNSNGNASTYNNNQNTETEINKGLPIGKMSQRNSELLIASNISPVVNADKRDEYSSIYNYVKTSEYKIEKEEYSDIIPDKPRESFIKYAANKIFSNKPKDENGNDKPNKVGIWDIVDLSTYGINSLAKNNLIEVNRTKENNVVKTDFALGGNVLYSRTSTDK